MTAGNADAESGSSMDKSGSEYLPTPRKGHRLEAYHQHKSAGTLETINIKLCHHSVRNVHPLSTNLASKMARLSSKDTLAAICLS